jgi:hypothetical protein
MKTFGNPVLEKMFAAMDEGVEPMEIPPTLRRLFVTLHVDAEGLSRGRKIRCVISGLAAV